MSEETKKTNQITLTIDDREISVDPGTTVLDAAAKLGIDIPTFCWHPKLDSIGACRMCLVDVEKIPNPAIACATNVMSGMVVHTATEEIIKARRGVLEFLLLNHPLDCPTCDKGGECDLQDTVFRYGTDKSRQGFVRVRVTDDETTPTFDDKRIGPEIIRNMNRCITCYKCVRFNKEIAGEFDLGAFNRGSDVVISPPPGEQIDNFYSGNVVEICPVGALTNTDWRYKIRVWNTKQSKSISSYDADGQNITLWHDDKEIFRATSRTNENIDEGWICDIARYGYQYLNSPDRLKRPLIRKEGKQVEASWEEAIGLIAGRFKAIKDKKGGVCIAGLAGGNLSTETLYLFNKFFRTVLNSNSVDNRLEYINLKEGDVTDAYYCLFNAPFKIASLEKADTVLIFGSNFIKDHPSVNLRLRKANRKYGTQVYTANPVETKSADISLDELIYKPETDAAFMVALIHAVIDMKLYKNIDASRVADLKSKLSPATLTEAASICGIDESRICDLARALASAKNPFILSGEYLKGQAQRYILANAIYNLANLLEIPDDQAAILAVRANSIGADRVGLRPIVARATQKLLTDKWGTEFSNAEGCNTSKILKAALDEEIDSVFVIGANPAHRYPDGPFVNAALDKLDFLIVADLFESATTVKADVVLPLAGWAETAGSFVNLEGRYQQFEKTVDAPAWAKSGIEIIKAIAQGMETPLETNDADLIRETAEMVDSRTHTPREKDRYFEVKSAKIEDHTDYPYYLLIGNDLHHFGHLSEYCPSLMRFTPEAYLELSPPLAAKLEIKEGSLVRVESPTGKLVLKAKISEIFDGEVLFIPNNFSATEVNSLVSHDKGRWVKIEKLDE